jgi:hypothetical protein
MPVASTTMRARIGPMLVAIRWSGATTVQDRRTSTGANREKSLRFDP